MTVDAERTVLVARSHRPLIGGGRPRVIRLRISEAGMRASFPALNGGVPSGVYYRSLLRRTFVAVVETDGCILFLDLVRNKQVRIDEQDVGVAVGGSLLRTFTITRGGSLLYRRRYIDLSALWKGLFFDQLEDAELDFFRSTSNEKQGGFANMRRFLSALR